VKTNRENHQLKEVKREELNLLGQQLKNNKKRIKKLKLMI